jgi:hypothetical protein
VTCAVTRNDREGVADRADVCYREHVADREDTVDIRMLEIETEIAFLEIENKDSFLLRVHNFLNYGSVSQTQTTHYQGLTSVVL